ncbi:cytochrome P450 [Nocardia sp. NPDC020380]|uniref:cytochrome P450 n=1 Tax=Nocardia sp. NPDC020380 TaxID=3364309 RepID=UPI0037B68BB0
MTRMTSEPGTAVPTDEALPSLVEDPRPYIPVVDPDASLPSNPTEQVLELGRRHGPLYARRNPLGGWTVFAGSFDLIDDLSDETRFFKQPGPALVLLRQGTGDGLFTAYSDEPNWAKAHNILLPAFSLGSMRTYHPAMLKVAKRLVRSWDDAAADGREVTVTGDMTRTTLDTIGLAGFGFDFESFTRTEPHPFVQAMDRNLAFTQRLVQNPAAMGDTGAFETYQENSGQQADIVDEIIRERRAAGDTSTDDLLGLMLNAIDPASGEALSDTNIRYQVITFLVAGHETTSGALSFALYYLAKNPAVLQRAQAEVDALWGTDPDPEPTYTDVGKLHYIHQVLEESLRLWPTAPGFRRVARNDTLLAGRYPLRAGDGVQVMTPLLHRDPVWGDNVESFDPERFTPEAVAARPGNAFKPFGTGERACIGRQFALHEAVLVLGMLVHRYRLLDHSDYRLSVRQTLTVKPEGFTLKLRRRTAEERRIPVVQPEAAVRQPDSVRPTRVRAGVTLTVLHGSNLGTCREFARDLAGLGEQLGCATTVAPLDSVAGRLPADGPVVIVAASYNGQPTDDAAEFVAWLSTDPAIAPDVRYAVLGVGDRNWADTYQRVPTLLDTRLAELGGTRLLPRGQVDVSADPAGDLEAFQTALTERLLEEYGDPTATEGADRRATGHGYRVVELHGTATDTLATHHDVQAMTVTEVFDLSDRKHPLHRIKRGLKLRLPEEVEYRTGDHVAVLPVNDPEMVTRAVTAFGVRPDSLLGIQAEGVAGRALPIDRPVTVSELLSRYVELGDRLSPSQLRTLARYNPCPPEQARLLTLAEQGGTLPTLVEAAEQYPAFHGQLSWPVLLDLLPSTRIRHYSVSSTPKVDARHIELMVSVTSDGVASRYLDRLRPGDTVLAAVQPCRESFRIAPDTGTPVIMIAAGTGLAPFRGAIADRSLHAAASHPLAPAVFYFGCAAPDVDFMHRDELTAADTAGVVSLRPAFSRADREYVQDRITADAEEIWKLLEDGAAVYVSGDGRGMAPAVRAAVEELCTRFTGATAQEAAAWRQQLCDSGRYVEDVYAGR